MHRKLRCLLLGLLLFAVARKHGSPRQVAAISTKRARRLAMGNCVVFALLAAGCAYGATAIRPGNDGPPTARRTLAKVELHLDQPDIPAGLSFITAPALDDTTAGLLLGLNLRSGQTVRWQIELYFADAQIRPELANVAGSLSHSRDLSMVQSDDVYVSGVAGELQSTNPYIITGTAHGPSDGYTAMRDGIFRLRTADEPDRVSLGLRWHGPHPSHVQGPYLTVTMPSIVNGGESISSRKPTHAASPFFAEAIVAHGGDYTVLAGSPPKEEPGAWIWTGTDEEGLLGPITTGVSSSMQVASTDSLFWAGLLYGIAGSAGVASLQQVSGLLSHSWRFGRPRRDS